MARAPAPFQQRRQALPFQPCLTAAYRGVVALAQPALARARAGAVLPGLAREFAPPAAPAFQNNAIPASGETMPTLRSADRRARRSTGNQPPDRNCHTGLHTRLPSRAEAESPARAASSL